jgi:7,8-dihydroneopterin aldolase/epimerase/oxygenase
MTDRIILADMAFFGRHGQSETERSDEQEIDVDVEMEVDLAAAGRSDDLIQTVNYSRVFDACREIVEQRSFHLLEAIAETIATRLLTDYERMLAVTVRVRKPGVPIDGRLEYAGVSIERRRAATD